MENAQSKVDRINAIASAWLEPDSAITSYSAMVEIIEVLENAPHASTAQRGAREAERIRWEQDRPDAGPQRPPRALRARSGLLG